MPKLFEQNKFRPIRPDDLSSDESTQGTPTPKIQRDENHARSTPTPPAGYLHKLNHTVHVQDDNVLKPSLTRSKSSPK